MANDNLWVPTKRKFYFDKLIGLLLVTALFTCVTANAQEESLPKEEKKPGLRDTLDGKFDFSSFVVDAKGFIPVPMIITEPALGGFGGMLAPVFLTPVKVPGYKGYIPPNITAGMGMYTVNGSWAVGAFRSGSFPKQGIRYRAFAGYADVNLGFYRNLPVVGEKELDFNIRAFPVSLSISKKLNKRDVYLGLQYTFSKTEVKPLFDGDLPGFIKPIDMDNNTASLGLFLDWDKRDNFFTPDKGFRFYTSYALNDNWTGSDFDYQRLNSSLLVFVDFQKNWISGFRAELQQAFNDPPFYLLPNINLRGVPLAKYQGITTAVLETEQRYDFSMRWSAVVFGGWGQAIERGERFGTGKNVYGVGTGFRYLLARVFNIRAGIDVAKGTDTFAWYIVFGHNWNR